MSTSGQAFVKAFARHGRTASVSGEKSSSEKANTQSQSRSAFQSATTQNIWLPGQEDRFTRIDTPQVHTASPIPLTISTEEQSHASAGTINIAAMQHIHTAYRLEPVVVDRTNVVVDHNDVVDSAEQVAQTHSRHRVEDVEIALVPLVANWELNVFDVPKAVANLFFEDGLFNDLSDRLLAANQGGLRSMLITSLLAGEGRSTVAMGMAMTAAASDLKVALVDANFSKPTLADDLRLDLDFGWVDHIRDRAPLSETAVHALEDNVTLFPLLAGRPSEQATPAQCGELLATLRSHFDLIVIDGEIAHEMNRDSLSQEIDSAVIVYDPSQSSDHAVIKASEQLRAKGIQGIGCVENFA